VKKVQHETGGAVAEIRIREGDRVNAGDLLVRLDATEARATFNMMAKQLDGLAARQARLEAERDDLGAIAFPAALTARGDDPSVAQATSSETRLFELRRTARASAKAELLERIKQLNEEISGFGSQRAGNERQSDLITEELAGVRELWEKHLVGISRLKALEREAARLAGEHGQLVAAIAQAKDKVAEAQLQIIQVDESLRAEVAKDLEDVSAKYAEFTERKIAAAYQLNHVDIVSPQRGKVGQLSIHVAGEIIAAREPIMLIIPDGDELVVESRIPPQERDRLREGQQAVLRFTSANQRATPEVEGRVSLISADLVQDERTGVGYYKVRIKPDAEQLSRLDRLEVVPGMPVEAHLVTGERTALSYLMRPLADRIARAFRED
jgi:HlyD family secretion protein